MSEAVRRWQAPSIEQPGAACTKGMLTAAQLAEIEAQARDAGYREGLDAGRRDGLAARAREANRLTELMATLAPQAGVLDDDLLKQLGELVVAIARQFVRRELKAQPGEIVRVVREALAALPASDARIRLFLHPDDVALVREVLHPDQLERPWHLIEDHTIARGGARIETDSSVIDATVETRLNAIAAGLLGDERDAGTGASTTA